MVETCPRCELKFPKYPLKDNNGNIIWKNLFRMDIVHLLFLISIVLLVIAYMSDIKQYEDIRQNPDQYCIDYCEESECIKILPLKVVPTNTSILDSVT